MATRMGGRPSRPTALLARWNALVNQSVHARATDWPMRVASTPRFVSPLSPPVIPGLWVEKGVIWQLPNLLVGFTSYAEATTFFASVSSFGYQPAPSSWYEGTPFSATDFPILHWGKKGVEINGFILVWASLSAVSFASTFLPMLPVNQPLIPSPCPSAGPVVSVSALSSFSANSPHGVKAFKAKYVMYSPFGPSPLSGIYPSGSGIQYDMIVYSWWYNF